MSDRSEPDVYALVPVDFLPVSLSNGFYLQVPVQALHLYGGFLQRPLAEADCAPAQVHADFRRTYEMGDKIFDMFYRGSYATFDALFEAIGFVVATADLLFQASARHRAVYLESRAAAIAALCQTLVQLFGFPADRAAAFQHTILDRSQQYVPDLVLGTVRFAENMRPHVKSDPVLFAQATHAYTMIGHSEVFRSMLYYSRSWLGSHATPCPRCSHLIRGFQPKNVESLSCPGCHMSIRVGRVLG